MPLLDQYPISHPQTAGRVIDEEAVVMQMDDNMVNVLNSVGARIWELSDGERTVGQIAAIIAGEYDVTLAEAEADVQVFVQDLVRLRMLVLSQNPQVVPA